jgi:hypothetical protein
MRKQHSGTVFKVVGCEGSDESCPLVAARGVGDDFHTIRSRASISQHFYGVSRCERDLQRRPGPSLYLSVLPDSAARGEGDEGLQGFGERFQLDSGLCFGARIAAM